MLESYITKTRDKDAALTFMKKALKRHGSPDAITSDGLRSYRAAMNELGNAEKQEIGRWANNRVENSHLPFQRRERAMLWFRQIEEYRRESEAGRIAAVAAKSKVDGARAKITARIGRLTDMMADGVGDYGEMKSRLATALRERAEIDQRLEEVSVAPALALHPNLAESYRRNVE